MSDLIHLETGARPWNPGPGVEEFAVLDEYNIPLAGLLRQQGNVYMYVCAAGEEEDANVWIYALVQRAEVRRLQAARDRNLLRVMAECMHNKPVVAAMAVDHKLAMWDWFDAGVEAPGVLVRRFLRRLEARVQRYGKNIDHLERDPSIDAPDPEQPELLAHS